MLDPSAATDHHYRVFVIRQLNGLVRSLGNKKAADHADTALDGLLAERDQLRGALRDVMNDMYLDAWAEPDAAGRPRRGLPRAGR